MRSRLFVAVLGIIVAALVVVAFAVELMKGPNNLAGQSSIPSLTSTPVAASSAPTATAVAPGPLRWQLVGSTGSLAGYSIGPVLRRLDGSYIGLASAGDSRIVTSTDGRVWVLQPPDDGLQAAPPDHRSLVLGIAQGATGLVAVGATALFDISRGDANAWASPDGVRWRAAARIAGMSDAAMEAVAAGPKGFVAVGSDGFPGGNTQEPGMRGAAVWSSADGRHWERIPDQAGLAGVFMTDVIRVGFGWVAWGTGHSPDAGAVWTSADGMRWHRARVISDADTEGAAFSQILPVPGGLIAVGSRLSMNADGELVPAAWTSSDGGKTWAPAAVDGSSTGPLRTGRVGGVALNGSLLIAVGTLQPADGLAGADSAAAWRSTDEGHTWARLPDDGSFARADMMRILALPMGFSVFGQTADPNAAEEPNLIWVAEPVA